MPALPAARAALRAGAPLLVTGALVVAALGACTATGADPTVRAPSGAPSAAWAGPTPSVGATASHAEALQQLAAFDEVNRRTIERHPDAGGRVIIDALVAAGYRRSAMQVTADRTSVGLAVPSVQFSVLWRGTCLIGQHGSGSHGYRSIAEEPVDGRCLIGTTRPIDW